MMHTAETRDRVLSLAETMPTRAVARETGVPFRTIRRWCEQHGIPPHPRPGHPPEKRALAVDMLRDGVPADEISALVCVPVKTIDNWRKAAGIPKPRFATDAAITEEVRLRTLNGETALEIAAYLRISDRTVLRIRKRLPAEPVEQPRPRPSDDWRQSARCAKPDVDPGIFHSYDPRDIDDALETCCACPVRADCLTWALDAGDTDAVLGGTTPQERRRMGRGA